MTDVVVSVLKLSNHTHVSCFIVQVVLCSYEMFPMSSRGFPKKLFIISFE